MLESELFAFLENTTDAVFVVTEQGEIRSWNKSAEKLFGYPAAEARGRTCFELLHGVGANGSLLRCLGEKACFIWSGNNCAREPPGFRS
jgi:PAS domain S-box-containing protein